MVFLILVPNKVEGLSHRFLEELQKVVYLIILQQRVVESLIHRLIEYLENLLKDGRATSL